MSGVLLCLELIAGVLPDSVQLDPDDFFNPFAEDPSDSVHLDPDEFFSLSVARPSDSVHLDPDDFLKPFG